MNLLIIILLFILVILKKFQIQENFNNWTESKINYFLITSIVINSIIMIYFFTQLTDDNNLLIQFLVYIPLILIPINIHFIKYNYDLTKPPLLIGLFIYGICLAFLLFIYMFLGDKSENKYINILYIIIILGFIITNYVYFYKNKIYFLTDGSENGLIQNDLQNEYEEDVNINNDLDEYIGNSEENIEGNEELDEEVEETNVNKIKKSTLTPLCDLELNNLYEKRDNLTGINQYFNDPNNSYYDSLQKTTMNVKDYCKISDDITNKIDDVLDVQINDILN